MKLGKIMSLISGVPMGMCIFHSFSMAVGEYRNINVQLTPMPTIDFMSVCVMSIVFMFVPFIFYSLGEISNN